MWPASSIIGLLPVGIWSSNHLEAIPSFSSCRGVVGTFRGSGRQRRVRPHQSSNLARSTSAVVSNDLSPAVMAQPFLKLDAPLAEAFSAFIPPRGSKCQLTSWGLHFNHASFMPHQPLNIHYLGTSATPAYVLPPTPPTHTKTPPRASQTRASDSTRSPRSRRCRPRCARSGRRRR